MLAEFRSTLNVSFPSTSLSFTMGTAIVALVCPAGIERVLNVVPI